MPSATFCEVYNEVQMAMKRFEAYLSACERARQLLQELTGCDSYYDLGASFVNSNYFIDLIMDHEVVTPKDLVLQVKCLEALRDVLYEQGTLEEYRSKLFEELR